MELYTWIKTDEAQWVRRYDESTFDVIEVNILPDDFGVHIEHIDITDYTAEEILRVLHYYSYNVDYVSLLDFDAQIIAECLAEDCTSKFYIYNGEFEDCVRYCEGIIEESNQNPTVYLDI